MSYLPDALERQKALDPYQSFIVQAPAGSGKTELLTQRFLALLGTTVTQPEAILALTFTRKAAGEMQQRIMQALLYAAKHDQPPDEAHAQLTWRLARKALAQDKQYHWQILNNPNRLNIQTIDSFCLKLIRHMPIVAHFGAAPAVCDQPHSYYQQAIRELFSEIITHPDLAPHFTELLLHVDNDLPRLEKLCSELLAAREQWLPHVLTCRNQQALRDKLRHNIAQLWQASLNEVVNCVPSYLKTNLPPLARFAGQHLAKITDATSSLIKLIELEKLPTADIEYVDMWLAIAQLLLTQDNQWRKRVDKTLGFLAPSNADNKIDAALYKQMKQDMTALLQNLVEFSDFQQALSMLRQLPPLDYSAEHWKILIALLEILPLLAARLTQLFRQANVADFIEISAGAITALGQIDEPSDLALRLDYQLQHILIDEFQDTSIQQYELLTRLTAGWSAGDGHTLFVVGDPMQSIYRFRAAEVGLFLRARKLGIGNIPLESLVLSSNFRSQAHLIDWVNQVFVDILPRHENMQQGAIPYSPAHAIRSGTIKPAVQFYACSDEITEAQRVVELITQHRQHFPEHSIAILVRARSHLTFILPALRNAQLAYHAFDLDNLSQHVLIQDLWTLTRALLYPADRLAWLSVLRAPWCGLTLTDLFIIAQWPEGIINALQHYSQLNLSKDAQQRLAKVAPILLNALRERRRFETVLWIEQVWQALDGPTCMDMEPHYIETYCQTYWDLLAQHVQYGDLLDIDAFEQQLAALSLAQKPEQTTENNAIHIMTMHKAKGLEFDCVIIPGLTQRPANNKNPLFLWLDRPNENASHDLFIAPLSSANKEPNLLYQYIRQELAAKDDYEASRLLYVACTRSKQQLFLLGCLQQDSEQQIISPTRGSLCAKLWPWINSSQNIAVETSVMEATDIDPQSIYVTRLKTNYFPLSDKNFSTKKNDDVEKLLSYAQHSPHTQKPDEPRYFEDKFFCLLGNFIHYQLKILCINGIKSCAINPENWIPLLLHWGIAQHDIPRALQLSSKALTTTLNSERGPWILNNHHHESHCELSITFQQHSETKQLIIDRTFVDDNNYRWIIDYKTTMPYAQQTQHDFFNQQQKLHACQLQCYRQAMQLYDNRIIRTALFFPMTGWWHELTDIDTENTA
ncbi:MAG: UvrD-helicase domain-containing protein [Gammaproteobacteria bacterium]